MTMSWTKNNSRLSGLSLLPSQIAHKLNSSPRRPSCHCTQTQREPSLEHSGGGLFADPLINTLSICSSSPQFAHERLNRAHPPLCLCKWSPLSNCSVNLVWNTDLRQLMLPSTPCQNAHFSTPLFNPKGIAALTHMWYEAQTYIWTPQTNTHTHWISSVPEEKAKQQALHIFIL